MQRKSFLPHTTNDTARGGVEVGLTDQGHKGVYISMTHVIVTLTNIPWVPFNC